MKKSKTLVFAALLAVVAASSSACQRGYGCPNDLSAASDLAAVAVSGLSVAQPSAAR